MRDFSSNDRDSERTAGKPPVSQEHESSWTTLGIAIALAVAVAIGAYFLGARENDISVTNRAATATTAHSLSSPTPDAGKTGSL